MLDACARLESSGQAAPIEVARLIESAIGNPEQRALLSEASALALTRRPGSPILIYLRLLGLIDKHEFETAHEIVGAALCRLCAELGTGRLTASQGRERAQALCDLWRILDSDARDQMRWLVEPHDNGAAYAKLDFVQAFEALPTNAPWRHHLTTLAFAEPLLQGKQQEAYLERCRLAFEQTSTLAQRLQVAHAVFRQGLRRVPDYGPAYRDARRLFLLCVPEIEAAMAARHRRKPKDPRAYVRLLRSAQSLATQVGEGAYAVRFADELRQCLVGSIGDDPKWMAANALSRDRDSRRIIGDLLGARPKRDQDLREFYQIVLQSGEYHLAHKVFEQLLPISRGRQSALIYANVLQRDHRFAEAEQVVRNAHAHMLANIDALNFFVSHRLIRRAGELKFAAETARYYETIPQPTSPCGVILVTPRSIEHLRRTPLVALMEWKKMGWAVVPIYEGILPPQKTGIEAIDRFASCIRHTNEFRSDVGGWMKAIEPLEVDYDAGKLSWRGIDLSHAMWEEGAINRRVYSVTWSCPALKQTLGNLVNWTEKTARVLETARETFEQLELRAGTQIFLNFRLPDAVVRFYCDRFGHPQDFFCVHASNGYENYFTNFESNISSRLTMRNMTAHPGVRSSSMPLAEDLERRNAEGAINQSLTDLIRTVRSKPQGMASSQERDIALRRIAGWRAGGGKVACAFGKVVCDSGVLYDGGPAHSSMRDWINDTISAATDSRTLLLIKPHPHELREEIACFLNETFRDLLPAELADNVIYLDHDWFETYELKDFVDLALVYNGTTAVEMALLEIPTVVASYFAPVDYPVGQTIPADREHYHRLVRFESDALVAPDGRARAAAWLSLMRGEGVSVPYRYHSRQITNCGVYPPFWFHAEIEGYLRDGDANVTLLAERGVKST